MKSTEELENVLGSTHLRQFDNFVEDNKRSMMNEAESFSVYVKDLIKEKGLTQQSVFLKADLPERYGYKLLLGEKRTKQRDTILRICYAAEFTLEQTQKALKKYEMPQLYVKIQRDALIMMIFNERPGSITDVNICLKSHGVMPLRTSGVQE